MIEALLALHGELAGLAVQGAVAFLRVGGVMLLLPGLGDAMIPARIRLVVALALAAAIHPVVPIPPAGPTPGLILAETATGLAFGAVLRFLASALTVAGMMAAQMLSLAQLLGAPSAEPSTVLGNVLNLAGLAILMASGLPLMVVETLIRSYDVVPVGAVLPAGPAAEWGIARLSHAFALALALAAPFALAALLYNAALGVVNRAMPQLMVALVGAPLATGAAGVILWLAAPTVLTVWKTAMIALLAAPGGLP